MAQRPDITVRNLDLGSVTPVAPERRAVPLDGLLRLLTAQFHACEGCENVRVVGATRLDTPDETGCNWSSTIVLDAAGVPAEVYGLAYAAVIGEARQTWNLK